RLDGARPLRVAERGARMAADAQRPRRTARLARARPAVHGRRQRAHPGKRRSRAILAGAGQHRRPARRVHRPRARSLRRAGRRHRRALDRWRTHVDRPRNAVRHAALIALATVMVVGCGSEAGPKAPRGVSQKSFEQQLADASNVRAADFPATRGRTLQEIASTATAGNGVGFATSVLVPGTQRLAFGVLDRSNKFVYGKTAVYVAASPSSKALGPYAA